MTLSKTQFGDYELRHNPGQGANIPDEILAFHKDKRVGWLSWYGGDNGEIQDVSVAPEHRRKGLATQMMLLARQKASEGRRKPPEHSSSRTPEGDAWAKSVGGKRPPIFDVERILNLHRS